MSNLEKHLKNQLKTDKKQEGEKILKVIEKLKELDQGRIWKSKFNLLVSTKFSRFNQPDIRTYKLTDLGEIFYKGLE